MPQSQLAKRTFMGAKCLTRCMQKTFCQCTSRLTSSDTFGGVLKTNHRNDRQQGLNRFFCKNIPPSLWILCDQTLQLNFILTHIPGVENPPADYLLRLQIRPEEQVHLKLNASKHFITLKLTSHQKLRNRRKMNKIFFLPAIQ